MRPATYLVALFCGGNLARSTTSKLDRALDGDLVQHAADNCTQSSQSTPFWRIDDFVMKVYDWDNGGSMGTFGFKSYYSATNTTVQCMAENVDLAKLGEGWSKCNDTGSEFQFDFTQISLTMKETWTCSGTVFNANATGLLMLHGCLDTNTEKGVESDCNLMELEMEADAPSSAMV